MKHKTTTKWGWGLFKRSVSMARNGKGMIWSQRVRNRWGWGLSNNRLNSPPKINNLFSMIYLWSWIWIEGRDRYSIFSIPYILKWFKYQSFLTHIKRGITLWLSPIHCNVKEYCKTLHDWNCPSVLAATSRR